MDDIPIRGREEDGVLKRFLAQYDAPAYVRRAREVEQAFEVLVSRCRAQRDEYLVMVRTRLGALRGLAGDWDRLRPWLADEDQVQVLRGLHADLEPKPRLPVEPTSSGRRLRRELRELNESIERFNDRWRAFLRKVDLSRVNELREGYNRYYLVEKECALRSARLARQGFRRLEPLTVGELAALLPLLPVLRLVG